MHRLKRNYMETLTEGPNGKRIHYFDVDERIEHDFHYASSALQMAVKTAFPNSTSARSGKRRVTYIVGCYIMIIPWSWNRLVQVFSTTPIHLLITKLFTN